MNKPLLMEILDLEVLVDLEFEAEDGDGLIPSKVIYAVGWHQDLDAGLYRAVLSPVFESEEDLAEWVNKNPEAILDELRLPEEERQEILDELNKNG